MFLSKGVDSRLFALDLLQRVNREGAFANIILPKELSGSKFDDADKAFITELVYSTLRLSGKYDFAIERFSDRPVTDIDLKLLDLLRLGAHQIYGMRTPIHAALNETVEVANKVLGKSKASFLNALLRKLSTIKDLDQVIEDAISDPLEQMSVKFSHPKWMVQAFLDRLQDLSEVQLLLKTNNEPISPNLVAWPGLSSVEELISEGAERLTLSNFAAVAKKPPHAYSAVKEKRAGVQDVGSQYLVELFFRTATPGLDWLDLCAAPGGKAKLLYQLLNGEKFTANEVNPIRFELLKNVLPSEVLTMHDGTISSNFERRYDRILIDAPCTGMGALRRRPEARWRKTPNDLKNLVKLQSDLLQSALSLLKPKGLIAYATCSPHLLETKVQIADFLHRNKNVRLRNLSEFSSASIDGLQPDGTMQLWTHRNASDSMFLALLKLET